MGKPTIFDLMQDTEIEKRIPLPPSPTKDDSLKWNGTEWVAAPYNTSFAMTIASFVDNQTDTQLIGLGTWKAIGAVGFTASYNNPPPSSAHIDISGVAWTNPLALVTPYTSVVSLEATPYPALKDQVITFTLTAYDGATPRSSAASVTFRNNIFWGNALKDSGFTESDVEALSSELNNNPAISKAINSGSGQYLVMAYPSSYASIHNTGFLFNSVTCPFNALETVSITNAAGYTENYKVYASVNANLGNSTLVTSPSSNLIDPIYWGVTTKLSGFTEADIEGLSGSAISNAKGRTVVITAAAGEYLTYALPVRLGVVTFWVGGFEGGFEAYETVSVTNVNGYTENYYIYRSTNSGLGITTLTVV